MLCCLKTIRKHLKLLENLYKKHCLKTSTLVDIDNVLNICNLTIIMSVCELGQWMVWPFNFLHLNFYVFIFQCSIFS